MAFILYCSCAIALLWLASRTVLRIPWRDALVLGLIPLVETGPALVLGRVLAPIDLPWFDPPLAAFRSVQGITRFSPSIFHDQWSQQIPWQQAVRWAWAAHEWPLWNPFASGGEPLLGSYQPGIFHPLHLLALLLPLPQALSFCAAAILFCAALSMYLFLRDLSISWPSALAGAAIWSYGRFIYFWLGWPVALAACSLPLVLLGARRTARSPGRSSFGLLTLALSLLLLAGNPEVAAVSAVLGLTFFVVELWHAERSRRWRALATGLAAATVALALAAVQLLPFLDAMTQTEDLRTRMAWRPPTPDFAGVERSTRLLAEHLVPFVHGVLRPGGAPSPRDATGPAHDSSWSGSVALLAALAALASRRTPRRLFYLTIAGIGIAFAIHFAPAEWLVRSVPVLALVENHYGNLCGGLAVAVLAAYGLDGVISGRLRRSWYLIGAVLAAGMTSVFFAARSHFPDVGLAPNAAWTRFAILIVPLLVAWVALPRLHSRTIVAALLLLLVVGERQLEMGDAYSSYPIRDFYPKVAPIHRLSPSSTRPFRVFGTGSYLYPDLATMWRFEDPRGYNPMTLTRWADLFPLWGARRMTYLVVADQLDPFLSLLNVRFALIPQSADRPPGWRTRKVAAGTRLVENRDVVPRAFVPGQLRWTTEPRESLGGLARLADFTRLAWLEPIRDEKATPLPARKVANGVGEVEILESGFRYRFRTRFESPGWVVVSSAAWRGWCARSGQARLPVAIADHALVAFRAPAGEHVVDLFYRPRSFEIGFWISCAALVALLLVATVRPRTGP